MMIERVRPTHKPKSKSVALASARWALFDHPPMLVGEDSAKYQELLAFIRAAVKPMDMIDDMYIADIAALEWEVLRWRRLKGALMQGLAREALESAMSGTLDYSHRFEDDLTKILQNLPNHPDNLADLAQACARDEPDALDKIKKLLDGTGFDLDTIRNDAQSHLDAEFMQEYLRHEEAAVTLVDQILAEAGTSVDVLTVNALTDPERLDEIERSDHLTALAEGRRNASLHEIDRRRIILGEALRRTVQEVEKDEVELIEAMPAKGDKAA
jgi:hypothetical protein